MVATVSKLRGLQDAKLFPLTKDGVTNLTYGSAVDIPTIQELSYSIRVSEDELKGDDEIQDVFTDVELIEFTASQGKLSLDALAALTGGSVTDGGTKQTFSFDASDIPGYFKLEAQVAYSDEGDKHVVFYKCKLSSLDVSLSGDAYATVSFTGKAIKTVNDGKLFDIVINETETAIS